MAISERDMSESSQRSFDGNKEISVLPFRQREDHKDRLYLILDVRNGKKGSHISRWETIPLREAARLRTYHTHQGDMGRDGYANIIY